MLETSLSFWYLQTSLAATNTHNRPISILNSATADCLHALNPGLLVDGCPASSITPPHCTVTAVTGLFHEVGAPFGSVMYEFVGKVAPFLILAVIAVLAGGNVLLRSIHIIQSICMKRFVSSRIRPSGFTVHPQVYISSSSSHPKSL